MVQEEEAPPEIKNKARNASELSKSAQRKLIESVIGAQPEQIVRRNPFDKDDPSETAELEQEGFTPINTAHR